MALNDCIKLYRDYQAKRITKQSFVQSFDLLIVEVTEIAYSEGLQPKEMEALVKEFVAIDLNKLTSTIQRKTIRCFIPVGNASPTAVREFLLWLVSNIFTLPITTLKIGFILIIALLEYDLIDSLSIVWAYEKFFCALNRDGMELIACKLIQMVTTPDHITRFRVMRLLNMKQKDRRPFVIALLGLYKTLRPDKVPEQVQILSYFPSKNLGFGELVNGMSKAQDRVKSRNEVGGYLLPQKKRRINWILDRPARKTVRRKGYLLPPMEFHSSGLSFGNIFEKPRLLVENRTMEELGNYILTSQSPSQSLALLSSRGGLFFLQFARQEVQQRLNFTLHHRLRYDLVEMLDKNVKEQNQLELLGCLCDMQEMHLCGSAVVTRFVSQFLRHHGSHPRLLQIILKLLIRPVFTSYCELHTSIFLNLETLFYTADEEQRIEIFTCVGNLILNLLWSAQQIKQQDERTAMEFTLNKSYSFYDKLFNVALASSLQNNYLALISTALHFYKMVALMELQLNKFKIWTLPPITLFLACLTSSHSWVLNSACALLLVHRDQAYEARKLQRTIYGKQIDVLNDIASNFSNLLYNTKTLEDLIECSEHTNFFCKFNTRTVRKFQKISEANCIGLDMHLALAPQRSVVTHRLKSEMEFEHFILFCARHLTSIHAFLKAFLVENGAESDE